MKQMSATLSNHQAIKEALIVLMREKTFREIKVQQIFQEAKVSRNTFYRSFNNKKQILMSIYDDAMDMLIEKVTQEIESEKEYSAELEDISYSIINMILTDADENIDFYITIYASDIDDLIYGRFKHFFHRLIGTIVRSLQVQVRDQPSVNLLILNLTGSAFHFLKGWVLDEARITAEEASRLYTRIIVANLQILNDLIHENLDRS